MKLKIISFFLFLSAAGLYGLKNDPLEIPTKVEQKIITHKTLPPLPKKTESRVPASRPKPARAEDLVGSYEPPVVTKRVPKALLAQAKVIPGNLKIVPQILAIKESDFQEGMGEVLDRSLGMVFFRSEVSNPEAANVAYDEDNDAFYPVSGVVKLRGVDESLRDKLLSSGLEEHYYHEKLKILYVKSSHEQVIPLYEELAGKKLDAHVEVIRGFHQPR